MTIGHDGELLDGVVAAVLGQEVDVLLALGLVELELPFPPALFDPLRVRAGPLHEPAPLRRGHQHAAGPELPPLLRPRRRVDVRVVQAELPAADELPRRVEDGAVPGVRGLRAQRLLPPEVGVQERDAADRVAVAVDGLLPQPYRGVVRHVGAGAVPGEDDAGGVPVRGEPGLGLCLGSLPAARGDDRLEGRERVLVANLLTYRTGAGAMN
nr:unnamed protein product [Digitaria exilis]